MVHMFSDKVVYKLVVVKCFRKILFYTHPVLAVKWIAHHLKDCIVVFPGTLQKMSGSCYCASCGIVIYSYKD